MHTVTDLRKMERTAVQQSAKQSDDHYATVSVAFVQAIEKRKKANIKICN